MGDGTGGGLDFQAGIFQKLMAEARRHAKRAASMSRGPLAALRATKLQRPISKEPKGIGTTKKKPVSASVGGSGGGGGTSRWWRAALRFLRWDRRDGSTTNADEIQEDKPKPRPNPPHARCTLYFVSAEPPPHGTGRCCRTRKRRAMAVPGRPRPEGACKMMMTMALRKPTTYMCLSDLNAVEEGAGRTRLVALVARPPPPPPIYWVT